MKFFMVLMVALLSGIGGYLIGHDNGTFETKLQQLGNRLSEEKVVELSSLFINSRPEVAPEIAIEYCKKTRFETELGALWLACSIEFYDLKKDKVVTRGKKKRLNITVSVWREDPVKLKIFMRPISSVNKEI